MHFLFFFLKELIQVFKAFYAQAKYTLPIIMELC